jgi:hypothetical protein
MIYFQSRYQYQVYKNGYGYGCYYYYSYTETTNYLGRIDITDIDNPKLLPVIKIPGRLAGVDKSGTIIYTIGNLTNAYTPNTLCILTIDDNNATLNSAIMFNNSIRNIFITDNIAYVFISDYQNNKMTCHVVDCTDKDNPSLLKTFTMPYSNPYRIIGKYMIFKSYYSHVISVYDISNPKDPEVVGGYLVYNYISQISIKNDIMYLSMGNYGLVRINLSNH